MKIVLEKYVVQLQNAVTFPKSYSYYMQVKENNLCDLRNACCLYTACEKTSTRHCKISVSSHVRMSESGMGRCGHAAMFFIRSLVMIDQERLDSRRCEMHEDSLYMCAQYRAVD